MTTDLNDLIRVREAADMVGLTEQTIRKAIKAEHLPVYKILGLDAVRIEDVKKHWAKRLTKGS